MKFTGLGLPLALTIMGCILLGWTLRGEWDRYNLIDINLDVATITREQAIALIESSRATHQYYLGNGEFYSNYPAEITRHVGTQDFHRRIIAKYNLVIKYILENTQ